MPHVTVPPERAKHAMAWLMPVAGRLCATGGWTLAGRHLAASASGAVCGSVNWYICWWCAAVVAGRSGCRCRPRLCTLSPCISLVLADLEVQVTGLRDGHGHGNEERVRAKADGSR